MSAQTGALKPLKAGTSGFRGKTYEEVTPEHARVIGAQYGKWLRTQRGKDRPTITVGHDQRFGAADLAASVMAGLLHVGVHAVNVGMVPTGVFAFGMTHMGHDGGILITGSHMDDPKRIGVIPVNGDSTYCTGEVTDFIADGFANYDNIMDVPPEGGGSISFADTDELIDAYTDRIVSSANATIRHARFRIVVDAGNGTMGEVTKRVFEALGIELCGLHMEPKEVPGRGSECTPANCGEAISMTMDRADGYYDLGIAFDGDGDRGMFISPTKGALEGDIIAGIFASWMLDEGDVCVTPVSTGALINHVARERDASVELCRVGQPATGEATKQRKATFYCEPASQKFGFPNYSLGYDALFALTEMLAIMIALHRSIDQLVDDLPVFCRREKVLRLERVAPKDRERGIADALITARRHFGDDHHGRVCYIDGLRFDFDDGSWVLMRPSGTEPVVRVYGSGQDAERVETLVREGAAIFRKHLGLDLND